MTHYEALSNRLLPDMQNMHARDMSPRAFFTRWLFSRNRADEVLQIAIKRMPVNTLEIQSGLRDEEVNWWRNSIHRGYDAKYGTSIIAMLILGALVNYAIRALLDWWFRGPEYAAQIKDARSELMG